jgi:hypothetical protein
VRNTDLDDFFSGHVLEGLLGFLGGAF